MGTTRYSDQLIYKTGAQERFLEYYTASIRKLEEIRINDHSIFLRMASKKG
jgi:hypothetical protein